MSVPTKPKIYHIVHVDRLSSIINAGYLWCDAKVDRNPQPGTTIGMSEIKRRRREDLLLNSHPDLHVGDCVPFYFCPRSIMLYLIYKGNAPGLTYSDGQKPIVHLEADLSATVKWADQNSRRWAFTSSNAGSKFFEDYCKLEHLSKINWDAVQAVRWSGGGISPSIKEGKQAEFLIERQFPWELISRIGVRSPDICNRVNKAIQGVGHRPQVKILPKWYY